jgi:hypothetical protein
MWQIDAPKVPSIIAVERLKHDSACHSPRHPSFYNHFRTLMQHDAPNGTR